MSVKLTQSIYYGGVALPVDGATLDFAAEFEADLVSTNRATYVANPTLGGLMPVEVDAAGNTYARGAPIDLGSGPGGGGSFGEFASTGTLETAHPAASNNGSTATVLGVPYISNGTDWVSVLTADSGGTVYKGGVPVEQSYTIPDADRLAGVTPAMVAETQTMTRFGTLTLAAPILVTAGTMAADGTITGFALAASFLLPPLTTQYYVWLPANRAAPATPAGLFPGKFLTATSFKLDSASGVAGAFTLPAATFFSVFSLNLPGGLLGPRGIIRINMKEWHNAATPANLRKVYAALNGSLLGGYTNVGLAFQAKQSVIEIANRNSEANQLGHWVDSLAALSANDGFAQASVNTANDSTLSIQFYAQSGTIENVVFESIRIEILSDAS